MATLISQISLAAELIKKGQVVVFPTDTVYGLGVDATNYDACLKVYELKGRPAHNPLIVHVANFHQAEIIADFSDYAILLARKFWPGPLTLVLKMKSDAGIASNVTAGLATVAIRVPKSDIAIALINHANIPIAAPSANISNYVTGTMAIHALHDFIDSEIYILSSLVSDVLGIESTIIDCSGDVPIILRHGSILESDIYDACGLKPIDIKFTDIIAPGMFKRHYATKSKLRLNAKSIRLDEVGIDFNSKLKTRYSFSYSGDLNEAAKNLYAILREVDNYAIENAFSGIAIASIPNIGIGIAINDKLTRASSEDCS